MNSSKIYEITYIGKDGEEHSVEVVCNNPQFAVEKFHRKFPDVPVERVDFFITSNLYSMRQINPHRWMALIK